MTLRTAFARAQLTLLIADHPPTPIQRLLDYEDLVVFLYGDSHNPLPAHQSLSVSGLCASAGFPNPPRLMDYIYYHYISTRLISTSVREPEPPHYSSPRDPNRRSRGPPRAQFQFRHRANTIHQIKIVAAASARYSTTILIKLEESVAL